jgi:hypothetical protein
MYRAWNYLRLRLLSETAHLFTTYSPLPNF